MCSFIVREHLLISGMLPFFSSPSRSIGRSHIRYSDSIATFDQTLKTYATAAVCLWKRRGSYRSAPARQQNLISLFHACQWDHQQQARLFVERPAAATEEQVQSPVSVALAVVEAAVLISPTAKRKSPNVEDFCKTCHQLSDTVLSNARKRVIGHLKTD